MLYNHAFLSKYICSYAQKEIGPHNLPGDAIRKLTSYCWGCDVLKGSKHVDMTLMKGAGYKSILLLRRLCNISPTTWIICHDWSGLFCALFAAGVIVTTDIIVINYIILPSFSPLIVLVHFVCFQTIVSMAALSFIITM